MLLSRRTLTQITVAAGLMLISTAGYAQTWWNSDYAQRIPVTITNPAGGIQRTANQPAEVPLALTGGVRADFADIRVLFWNGTAWQERPRQVLLDSVDGETTNFRVVFRLASALADGATSTGQYFIYLGNPSPQNNVEDDVHDIYDHVVDCLDGTVGQPAAEWIALEGGTATVDVVNGIQSCVLRNTSTPSISHPRYIVAPGAMPNFLNAESHTQFTAMGGENEVAPLLRVPNSGDTSARGYGGGMGYVTDGFGSQQGLVSVINPTIDRGPDDLDGTLTPTNGANATGVIQNVLFRYEDQLLWGKKWSQAQAQPAWVRAEIDRAAYDPQPAHGGVPDPLYDQPGATGIASYNTNGIAVHFIAIRELITEATAGAVENNTAAGPFIQGTLSSSLGTLNPLTNACLLYTSRCV